MKAIERFIRRVIYILINLFSGAGIPILWYSYYKLTTRLPDGRISHLIEGKADTLFLTILGTIGAIAVVAMCTKKVI